MHVLMISLDASLLGDPHGNTVQRHIDYARRIGRLSIVVYNPASNPKTVQRLSDELTVYPTNTRPYLYPLAAYRAAARLMRDQRADVVSTQDPFATGLVGLWLKRRFRVPLDVQNHSSFLNNAIWLRERPLRNRLLVAVGRLVIPRADTHRVLTEGEKQHYLALGVPGERVTVLSTPTDVGQFAQPVPPEQVAALRESLDIPPGAPVVLWVGLPVGFKNVGLLLDAFAYARAEQPDARLVLVGDFAGRPDLVRGTDPDAVRFAGRVAHADLPGYYALADVYAHSSRYEGFGKVLVEALAAGTPVATTRADGPCSIIRDGETGLLCDHTPGALGGAVATLLGDPDRAQAMGAAGRADVLERFDYARQLDAVAATFRHTLEVARS
jgi:glycosyltransferase involved in cell wall biosynthesis